MIAEQEHAKAVRIHIDERRYESPNPTTGVALYQLAHVTEGLDLYREVQGDHEDKVVEKGPEIVHLAEDEHFHSGKPEIMKDTIVVNGAPFEWTERKITYDQVVTLDVPDYPHQNPQISYSVKYKNGPRHKPDGTLSKGNSVKVREGMTFCVTPTSQS